MTLVNRQVLIIHSVTSELETFYGLTFPLCGHCDGISTGLDVILVSTSHIQNEALNLYQ